MASRSSRATRTSESVDCCEQRLFTPAAVNRRVSQAETARVRRELGQALAREGRGAGKGRGASELTGRWIDPYAQALAEKDDLLRTFRREMDAIVGDISLLYEQQVQTHVE